MTRYRRLAAGALFVWALAMPGLQGQRAATGVIKGVVTDTAGGVLPGVTVTVQGATLPVARTAVTSGEGRYEVTGLSDGTFRVTFHLAGFKSATREGVVVRDAAVVAIDQKLEIGALGEHVYVTSGMPFVSTHGATVSQRNRAMPPDTARYARIESNRFTPTSEERRSTFGADVDTASYTNVRRFLSEGQLPPIDAVRVEEFVNYFRFDYDRPSGERPVAITSEVGPCPWAPGNQLVLIGARARASRDEAGPRNLVFLLDVSGSMSSADRLPLLKTALAMFVDTLRPTDTIGIVTYSGNSGVALRPTAARHRERILGAINALNAGGSTNGGAGLMLAYDLAREHFVRGGVNRVLLATDGDFNVGVTGQDDLYRLIDREKRSGVFLSVLGVGTHNLQDQTMEMLADKGNGHYSYLDSLQEARRVLIREGGSTLETVAKDVKFQVEFNPAVVQSWKLIGYENRLMEHEDFNNDRKDGGELGAGHTVTVLYEVVPVRTPRSASRNDLLTVQVRYTQPDERRSQVFATPVRGGERGQHLPFAAAVAEFGLLLRDDDAARQRWERLVSRVQALAAEPDPSGERPGFARMVELAAGLRRLR